MNSKFSSAMTDDMIAVLYGTTDKVAAVCSNNNNSKVALAPSIQGITRGAQRFSSAGVACAN